MTFYEQRLADDRREIQTRVVAVGRRVRNAVDVALRGLMELDRTACSGVILGDHPINRESRAISRLCHAFIARHLPSGSHLRFVSAVLQMVVGLERIGDYAVTIAREAVQLSRPPGDELKRELRDIGQQATTVLDRSLDAFEAGDALLARETKSQARLVGRTFAEIFHDLTTRGAALPLADAFGYLTVFHRLERVGDQAKNLCEETIFCLTGETKAPRQYEILFVDARCTVVAPLAVALARKVFPESGRYTAVGYQAGESLAPELLTFADEISVDVSELRPRSLPDDSTELERFHVIVGLTAEARARLPRIPYASAYVQWQVPKISDPVQIAAQLRNISRHLSTEIHDLMTTLRGEEAS